MNSQYPTTSEDAIKKLKEEKFNLENRLKIINDSIKILEEHPEVFSAIKLFLGLWQCLLNAPTPK